MNDVREERVGRFATKNSPLSDIKERENLAANITATSFQYQTTREEGILI
jgi:hypothetical protein